MSFVSPKSSLFFFFPVLCWSIKVHEKLNSGISAFTATSSWYYPKFLYYYFNSCLFPLYYFSGPHPPTLVNSIAKIGPWYVPPSTCHMNTAVLSHNLFFLIYLPNHTLIILQYECYKVKNSSSVYKFKHFKIQSLYNSTFSFES